MNVEEHWMVMEPVEKLEEILLDDSNLDRTTKIGTLANPAVRKHSQLFLEIIGMYLPGATKTCRG